MTLRRRIYRIAILALLIIPLSMMAAALRQSPPDAGLELAYTCLGIPILVLNAWEFVIFPRT
jgi:hypothetical protein